MITFFPLAYRGGQKISYSSHPSLLHCPPKGVFLHRPVIHAVGEKGRENRIGFPPIFFLSHICNGRGTKRRRRKRLKLSPNFFLAAVPFPLSYWGLMI